MPDYQFYYQVLQDRIESTERRLVESGRPWTKELRAEVDKAIENTIYDTQEEFHRYYKARDEKYMALAEEQVNRLTSANGQINPQFLKIFSESEEKFYIEDQADLQLLLTAGDKNLVTDLNNEIDDDEIDDDEIDDDPTLQTKRTPTKKPKTNKEKFVTTYEERNEEEDDPITGKLYKGYNDMNLYRRESDESPSAGVDRIMAHFKARQREQVHKQKITSERDEYEAFFSYIESNKHTNKSFEHSAQPVEEQHEQIQNFSLDEVELPTNELLESGKTPHEDGRGSEHVENKKIRDKIKNMKSEQKQRKKKGKR